MRSRHAILVVVVGAVLGFVSAEPALATTPEDALKTEGQFQFDKTPLKDVSDFISKSLKVPVKLDKGIDGTVPVTVKHTGTLKDMLKLVLPPLGLEYAVEKKEIVLRKKKSDE